MRCVWRTVCAARVHKYIMTRPKIAASYCARTARATYVTSLCRASRRVRRLIAGTLSLLMNATEVFKAGTH